MDHPRILKHEELLIVSKLVKGYKEVPSPRSIPVHPEIYRNPNAYTAEFVNNVRSRLQGSIERDLKAIREVLDWEWDKEFDWSRIRGCTFRAKPGISVDVGIGDSNIALSPGSNIEYIASDEDHFPERIREKLGHFSLTKDGLAVPVWYSHNANSVMPERPVILRCFAIEFNNYGIETLVK